MKTRITRTALTGLFTSAVLLLAQYPNHGSPLGTNLMYPCDWTTTVVWVDMFMWIRGWENSATGGGAFPPEQLDSSGYLKYLNPGEEAWVGHGTGTDNHYPGGEYLLTWDGDGTFEVRTGCTFTSYDEAAGRAVVNVDSTSTWWGVKLTRTNPANYVRNIHCIMPGFWDTWQNDVFHPDFVATTERFKVLRFMQWGHMNGDNPAVEWSDLKPGHYWNQSHSDNNQYGHVSALWMIRTANRFGADGWFCMPHRSSDDLLRKYATLVRDSLGSGQKAYVEFSNECWNWGAGFSPQTQYCTDKSVELGLGGGPAEGYAVYSANMWRIWREVFAETGQQDRLICVLADHGANPAFSYMWPVLDNPTHNPTNEQPDVISIAPYIHSGSYPISQMTHDQYIDVLLSDILPEVKTQMQRAANIAASRGVKMVAYEGGGHLINDVPQAQAFYDAVNHHPRMKDVYLAYLNDWFEVGGDMFCHYQDIDLTLGTKDYYNQPRSEAIRFDALLTFIEDSIGYVPVSQPFVPTGMQVRHARHPSRRAFVISPSGRLLETVPGMSRMWGTGRARGLYLLADRQANARPLLSIR